MRRPAKAERDYKPQLGAKAIGIYGSIWRCASNQSLRAIIGLERLMDDNGIKSKGGLYPHLRKLEAAGLIEIRNRTTPSGSQLANEYTLLDPYLPRLLDLSTYADFLLNGGSKNDPILEIKSPVKDGRDLIFLDLDEIYAGNRADAQNPPPQLSQAAEAGGTGISSVVDQNEPATEQRPPANELDVAYEAIPEEARPEGGGPCPPQCRWGACIHADSADDTGYDGAALAGGGGASICHRVRGST